MATDPLQAAAQRALESAPDQSVIEYDGRWHDWREIRHVADRIATLITASGADPRAPVAFVPRNRPAAIATFVALLAGGHVIRMVYAFQSASGIARDVARTGAAVAIVAAEDDTPDLRATLAAEGIAGIALTGMDAGALPGLERATGGVTADTGEKRIEILTSGTTGPPKRFSVSYDMVTRHIITGNMMYAGVDPATAPPALLYYPLGNITGIYTTLPAMLGGFRVTLLDRFSLDGWRDHLRRYRPAASGLPPAGVQMLLDADVPREELASIRSFGVGAAPLDPTAHRLFEQRYGIPILLSYGATEFGGPVTTMTPALRETYGDAKLSSVGRPFGGAQVRVVDPETRAELPPGEEGALEVVSPRIGPDWIRTSDIALIDADGFLYHRGRADGAIMRGGFKLLPETIERALALHPAVAAAGVVGIADHRMGQVPAAAVQLRSGHADITLAELETHLREHVYATHIPVHWRLVEALPLSPSMKVDRPALARLFEDSTAS